MTGRNLTIAVNNNLVNRVGLVDLLHLANLLVDKHQPLWLLVIILMSTGKQRHCTTHTEWRRKCKQLALCNPKS